MTRRNVTKVERETIVNFNEAEDIAVIYTFNNVLKKKLVVFSKKYPDLCKMSVNNTDFGSVTYVVQKSRVSVRLVSPYSNERRRAASEYAKKNGIGRSNSNKKDVDEIAQNC